MHRRTALAAGATALAGCGELLEDPDRADAEALIREAINQQRASAGLDGLARDDGLAAAAREHSHDMHDRGFYAHENPDGQDPWDRVACQASENIHRGEIGRMQNPDSDETWLTGEPEGLAGYVVEGWTLSDTHHEIMTDRDWDAVGVGVAIADGVFFAAAKFC